MTADMSAEEDRLLVAMLAADRRYTTANDEGLSEEVLRKLLVELRAAQDAFAAAAGLDKGVSHD